MTEDTGTAEKREVGRFIRGWSECERLGYHLFIRDYFLGIVPVGRPYCTRCGTERTLTAPVVCQPPGEADET